MSDIANYRRLAAEARCLTNHDWWKHIPEKDLIQETIVPLEDAIVEQQFLQRFHELYKETHG